MVALCAEQSRRGLSGRSQRTRITRDSVGARRLAVLKLGGRHRPFSRSTRSCPSPRFFPPTGASGQSRARNAVAVAACPPTACINIARGSGGQAASSGHQCRGSRLLVVRYFPRSRGVEQALSIEGSRVQRDARSGGPGLARQLVAVRRAARASTGEAKRPVGQPVRGRTIVLCSFISQR